MYYAPAAEINSTTVHSLQQELQRVLVPAGIHLAFPKPTGEETEEFERIVVGSLDGDCSVIELPLPNPVRARTDILADAKVSQRGQVLPFFHVDCSSVARTIRPALNHVSIPMRNTIFGRALARVMAHEIYHILAQSTDHAESGVAKPKFSIGDLIGERFDFNLLSLIRMRTAPSTLPSGDLVTKAEEAPSPYDIFRKSSVTLQSGEVEHGQTEGFVRSCIATSVWPSCGSSLNSNMKIAPTVE